MAKAPTIVDIADNLGISPISVSRALRNAGHVSEALRIKILEEADRLRYSPNNAARALRNKSSYLVGLIVPNFFSYQIDELVTEIQNYTQLNDRGLILGLTQWSGETEIKQLEFMVSKNVDGIIIKTYGSAEVIKMLRRLVKRGTRIVCLLDDFDCGAYSVTVDNISGGMMAGEYLIEKGHRNICYLTYETAQSRHYSVSHFSNERFEGLRRAMSQSDLHIDQDDIIYVKKHRPNEPFSVDAFNVILEKIKNYTAVFSYDDFLSAGLMKILQQNGLRVPQDCSIIGFDDSPAVSHWSNPAITVIKQPDRLIAYEAVKFILEDGHDTHNNSRQKHVGFFKPELVIRDSVQEIA